jgi:soluble lytic murein transglycosylase-like protein
MSKKASEQGGLGLAEKVYNQLNPGDRLPSLTNPATSRIPWKEAAAYEKQATPPRATPAQVDAWTLEAAKTNRVDPELLKSLVRNESAGDSLAVSRSGAQGLTQLMPGTARDMGVTNSLDGRQNVMGGARYLRKMLDRFEGREDLALAAYNAGPENVMKHGGIPPFAETQNYVKKVLEGRKVNGNTEVDDAR